MAFGVKIILDSISPAGVRLTTLTATYPRFIHAEVMTHRMFARNAASSRAIPWAKMRQAIIDDPVMPIHWGAEQKGMQSGDEVENPAAARDHWLTARDFALAGADRLYRLGVHKSLVNRLVEPWMWITTLITATEWKNFYRLRVHPDAERHFQRIAGMMQEAMAASTPRPLGVENWHLPFIDPGLDAEPVMTAYNRRVDLVDSILKRVSAARCARISYLTHDGRRSIEDDLALFSKLIDRNDNVIHASPLEHVATPMADWWWVGEARKVNVGEVGHKTGKHGTEAWSGPFRGWRQFRKEFENENVEG